MSTVDASTVTADTLRTTLVALVPEWEKRYGVAPFITAAVSEYDAARLVGHTPETFSLDCVGRTAVTRGTDFVATVFGIRSKLVGPAENPVRSLPGCRKQRTTNGIDWSGFCMTASFNFLKLGSGVSQIFNLRSILLSVSALRICVRVVGFMRESKHAFNETLIHAFDLLGERSLRRAD